MLAESFTQRGAPELNVAFDHFIRQTDWRATGLGPMHSWDPHLKAGVDMLAGLASPALLLCGGSNLVVHNDLCARWLGGDVAGTGICGRKLAEAWPLLADVGGEAIACAQGGKACSLRATVLKAGPDGVAGPGCADLYFAPVLKKACEASGKRAAEPFGETNGEPCGRPDGARNGEPFGEPIAVLVIINDSAQELQAPGLPYDELVRDALIYSKAPVGLCEISLDCEYLRVNDEFCRMQGRSREQLLSIARSEVLHPDDRAAARNAVAQVAATGVPLYTDRRYVRPDGKQVWATASYVRLEPRKPGLPYTVVGATVDLTERMMARQALEESEARFRALAEASPLIIWQLDAEGNVVYVNPKCYELFRGEDVTSGKAWHRAVHVDDVQAYLDGLQLAQEQRSPFQRRIRIYTQDGSVRWIDTYTAPWFRTDGNYAGLVGVSIDTTETVQAQEQLSIANERLKLAIEGSGDGVWDWDIEQDLVIYSDRMKEMCGLTSAVEAQIASRQRVHPDDLPRTLALLDDCRMGKTPTYSNELRLLTASGDWKWMLMRGIVVARKDGKAIRMTGTATDISEQKRAQETIWLHANFDALTSLPNRRLFRDRLDHEVKVAHRAGTLLALLFIDLDHFKEVNDLLGHDAGDLVLVQAASRIVSCVRESDTVARLGGDEFTTILTELETPFDAENIASKINQALAVPFMLGEESLHLTASIGITLYPTDGTEPDQLTRHADQAMYVAKSNGRDQFNYYTAALQSRAQDRLRLIADLRYALRRNELEVYYQPVVNLRTGRIGKAEALLRWNHPRRGFLTPASFVPFAEESGLISDIGDWVFRQAAASCKKWRDLADPSFQVSINRSPVQFMSRSTGGAWTSYLADLGLSGQAISVEITEAVLLNMSGRVTQQLEQYRGAGMQVAIDDFGTGYSSLAYLKKLDIDYLKIDQTFVRDMQQNDDDCAIVRSVTAMAHELGLRVIAEGVETVEQVELLLAAGCDYGQGYYFSRPMPFGQFEHMLLQHRL